MSQNLIQTLLGLLGPQVIDKVAALIGEPHDAAKKGLLAALPTMVAGLIGGASTPAGASGLLDLLKSQKIDGGALDKLSDLLGGGEEGAAFIDKGAAMATGLFGDRFGPLTTALAGLAGLKPGSAGKLMGLAAPLALGGLAKAAPPAGFNVNGVMSFLAAQRPHVEKLIPPSLLSLIGLPPAPVQPAAAPAEQAGSVWPWLIAAAAVTGVVVLGVRSCARPAPPPATTAQTVPAPPREIVLPGGTRLLVDGRSIGSELYDYLSTAEPAPKTFVFEDLTFGSGSATLDAAGRTTVAQVQAILQAFPDAAVKITGHTDSIGNAGENRRLSLQRAQAVAQVLREGGLARARVAVEGLGSAQPRADDATAEGQAKNRRIELVVTRK